MFESPNTESYPANVVWRPLQRRVPGLSFKPVSEHFQPIGPVGKIKAIAVLSDRALPQLPNVPTAASIGYNLNVRSWNGS